MNNFLNTVQAVKTYATLAAEAKGDAALFMNRWRDVVEDHGITVTEDVNEADLMPVQILDGINDAIRKNTVFAQFHPHFGMDSGRLLIEPADNVNLQSGHKRNATKLIQQVQVTSRNLVPAAIYKLQRLDHMTFLKGGALVEWVLSEMPRRVVNLISIAIIKGGITLEDGTPFDAIYPIIGDSLAKKTTLGASYTAADLQEALLNDVAELDADNPTIFMSPAAWAKLALAGDAWSVGMLSGALNLGGNIVKTTLLDAQHPYLVVDTYSYYLGFQGDGIETLSDFAITSNSEYVESRAYVAGSLLRPNVATYAEVGASASNSDH